MKDERLAEIEKYYHDYEKDEKQLSYSPLHILSGYVPELIQSLREERAKVAELQGKWVEIFVYEENCCDTNIEITNSNGFSLEELIEINKDLQEHDFTNYYRMQLILRPYWNEAQIGNYPPPNIECDGYWGNEILKVTNPLDV